MSARRPNILWIVTTQWRAQASGYAGDPNARTPHLDALAASSVNFVDAVTPHPFGPFARAALLTGVPSPQNGVRDYFDPLPGGARTIAHEMEARGYATAHFGKWHLARRDSHAPLVGAAHARMIVPPAARGGFALWEGFESGFQLNDPWLHGSRLAEPVQFNGYQSDVVCARAAEWIMSAGEPWFCVVSLEAPHPPYTAPSGSVAPRPADEVVLAPNVPRGGAIERRARAELAGYYAHIEATDRAIGQHLLAHDSVHDAVTVFTSVHGDMHGAHGLFRKGWPHEESVRVPLLLRVPGATPRREAAAVSLRDVFDLTINVADGGMPETLPTSAQISMPSIVSLRDQCDREWRGVRTAKRKLVLDVSGEPWLFFDLERDPWELENRAADPAAAAEIAALRALVAAG